MDTLLVHGLKIDYMHGSSIIIILFHEDHRMKKEGVLNTMVISLWSAESFYYVMSQHVLVTNKRSKGHPRSFVWILDGGEKFGG